MKKLLIPVLIGLAIAATFVGGVAKAAPQGVVLNFNVNSPDGFGVVVTTTNSYDLLVTVYPTDPTGPGSFIDICVQTSGLSYTPHQAEGLEGEWHDTCPQSEGAGWLGYFPAEGPVEVWLHMEPLNNFSQTFTTTASVVGETVTSTVTVISGVTRTYLPLIVAP